MSLTNHRNQYPLSFDDKQTELVLLSDGLLAVAFDPFPYGSPGRIIDKAT